MTKELLIEKLLKGDSHSFEIFVKVNQDKVFRTCLGYVQNEHDALDITQEVFIKAYEKIDQFKGDSKISTWLLKIAINLSLNFLRDNKKRQVNVDISAVKELTTENNSDEKQMKKAVRKAIYNLPEKQRRVFILSFYLDLSYKEIAEITQYSISSIESLLFRARKNLKSDLQSYYETFYQVNASF